MNRTYFCYGVAGMAALLGVVAVCQGYQSPAPAPDDKRQAATPVKSEGASVSDLLKKLEALEQEVSETRVLLAEKYQALQKKMGQVMGGRQSASLPPVLYPGVSLPMPHLPGPHEDFVPVWTHEPSPVPSVATSADPKGQVMTPVMRLWPARLVPVSVGQQTVWAAAPRTLGCDPVKKRLVPVPVVTSSAPTTTAIPVPEEVPSFFPGVAEVPWKKEGRTIGRSPPSD